MLGTVSPAPQPHKASHHYHSRLSGKGPTEDLSGKHPWSLDQCSRASTWTSSCSTGTAKSTATGAGAAGRWGWIRPRQGEPKQSLQKAQQLLGSWWKSQREALYNPPLYPSLASKTLLNPQENLHPNPAVYPCHCNVISKWSPDTDFIHLKPPPHSHRT